MGNKPTTEVPREGQQELKEDDNLATREKERKKKQKKDLKRRKKNQQKKGVIDSEEEEGGSDGWSGKSQVSGRSADNRSLGSAPESWYHSASEPSSRRSSVYLPASSGPEYYQHRCWYPGYEESSSTGSKSRSRTPSIREHLQSKTGTLGRYPLGVPTRDAIDPIQKTNHADLLSHTAAALQKEGYLVSDAHGHDEITESQESPLPKRMNSSTRVIVKGDMDIAARLSYSSFLSAKYGEPNGAILRVEKRKAEFEEDPAGGRSTPGAIQDAKRPLLEKTIIPLPLTYTGDRPQLPDTQNISLTPDSATERPWTPDIQGHVQTQDTQQGSIAPETGTRSGTPDIHGRSTKGRHNILDNQESPYAQNIQGRPLTPVIQEKPRAPGIQGRPVTPDIQERPRTPGTQERPLTPNIQGHSYIQDIGGRPHTPETGTRPRSHDVRRRSRSPIIARRAHSPDRYPGYPTSASDSDDKRSLERASVGGSIYYSCDEGGSIYYSLTSGSEIEDYADERDLSLGDHPSPPSKPEAVDREGNLLSGQMYFKGENDALVLRWDAPVTDGGSVVTGYIIERSEDESDFWVRVNLIPVKDLEYTIVNLYGGRDYRFRVAAENALGLSDPSPPSDVITVASDQEATEPHFLRELRNIVAVENQQVEFTVDVIGTPPPDITWYKDGAEVYDTKTYEFRQVGDRYSLILLKCQLSDEGDLKVRASNRAGVASSQATLRVQAPPAILTPPLFEQSLIFDTDEIIRLKVPYAGRPQPCAFWSHNGKAIENDERHSIDVTDNFVTLKVTGAKRPDKGLYSVRITNPLGEASDSFFVTVTDRPNPPGKPIIRDHTGQTLTLQWDPPEEDGGCRVNNYIVEYFRIGWDVWLKATSSSITWLQLGDLIVGSEYRFRIKAENAYGVSEPSPMSEAILIEENGSEQGSLASGSVTPENSSPLLSRKQFIGSPSVLGSDVPEVEASHYALSHEAIEADKSLSGTSSKETEEMTTIITQDDIPDTKRETKYHRSDAYEASMVQVESMEAMGLSEVEQYLGDYLNRWEAYGGQTLEKQTSTQTEIDKDLEIAKLQEIEPNEPYAIEKAGVSPIAFFEEQIKSDKIESKKRIRVKPETMLQETLSPQQSSSDKLSDVPEFHNHPPLPTNYDEKLYENVDERMIFKKSEDFLRENSPAGSQPPLVILPKEGRSPKVDNTEIERMSWERLDLQEDDCQDVRSVPLVADHSSSPNVKAATSIHTSPSPLPTLEGCELLPIPPPREKRSNSRASTISDTSLSIYGFDMSDGGNESPRPPPRSKRSSSRTSLMSETSIIDAPATAYEVQEEKLVPPPRTKRSGSRLSDVSLTDVALNSDELQEPIRPRRSKRSRSRGSHVSQDDASLRSSDFSVIDCPTPPPRSRRSTSRFSDASDTSMTSCDLPLSLRMGHQNSGSRMSNVSSNESMEMEVVPVPPPRSKRTSSRISNLSDSDNISFIDEGRSLPPTPPRRRARRGGLLSLTPSSSAGSLPQGPPVPPLAAPDSTPSLFMGTLGSVKPRMEEVTVTLGEEAVLVVALEGIPVKEIIWQKSGERLEPSYHYSTSSTSQSAQLVIHQAATTDVGTYTAIVTRPDGSQAKASVALCVAPPGSAQFKEAPTFVRALSDLSAKVGTRVRFLVELRSAHDVTVSWYHHNQEMLESSRMKYLHEGNFFCADISPLSPEDEGTWRCLAENASGQATCSATLRVIVPKGYRPPIFLEELEALLTSEGTVSLECKVVGVPTPILKWYKDGSEIKAGDVFALTANPDDPTSLGMYTCEAINCMGRATSKSKVRVVSREPSGPPSRRGRSPTPIGTNQAIFIESLQDHRVKIGEKSKLSVTVGPHSKVEAVSWYNNGRLIEISDKYRLCDEGGGRFTLEVGPLEVGDDGEWKAVVKADGSYFSSSCKLTLAVPKNYRAPRFLENLRALLTEEGLVSFECKVVGYPTPLLHWFKDGQELKPGDVYQLSGTNSLGKYSCIAKNCMGEAISAAELTLDDIKSHLNDDEREQLLATNVPPRFIQSLRSKEVKIGESVRFSVHVTTAHVPHVTWYRADELVVQSDKYKFSEDPETGVFHLDIVCVDFNDQDEWRCEAKNEFGHSVSAASLKLTIPRHYKKPVFLEALRANLSPEGTVNLECKVIGVPQPVLKWFKDGKELKPGDIHRIISGEGGTCCLGTYTCEAHNCMGVSSSSASLLGFEDTEKLIAKDASTKGTLPLDSRGVVRNPSLSTINEERSSQISIYESAADDGSADEEKAEVSVSIDGKEISLSLYETPDISEAEAKQIAEIYAQEISDHLSGQEGEQAELPPLRFTRESSRKGSLLMEAMVIDVENQAFDEYMSLSDMNLDDLRTEADIDEFEILDHVVVDEREPLRSDIADIPEMEIWGEQAASAVAVAEGKGVAQVSEMNPLETDLRSLSVQGLSILQTKSEDQTQDKSSGEEDQTKKVKKVKASLLEGDELKTAEVQEQVVMSLADVLPSESISLKTAEEIVEGLAVADVGEQKLLSQEESLQSVESISELKETAHQVEENVLEPLLIDNIPIREGEIVDATQVNAAMQTQEKYFSSTQDIPDSSTTQGREVAIIDEHSSDLLSLPIKDPHEVFHFFEKQILSGFTPSEVIRDLLQKVGLTIPDDYDGIDELLVVGNMEQNAQVYQILYEVVSEYGLLGLPIDIEEIRNYVLHHLNKMFCPTRELEMNLGNNIYGPNISPSIGRTIQPPDLQQETMVIDDQQIIGEKTTLVAVKGASECALVGQTTQIEEISPKEKQSGTLKRKPDSGKEEQLQTMKVQVMRAMKNAIAHRIKKESQETPELQMIEILNLPDEEKRQFVKRDLMDIIRKTLELTIKVKNPETCLNDENIKEMKNELMTFMNTVLDQKLSSLKTVSSQPNTEDLSQENQKLRSMKLFLLSVMESAITNELHATNKEQVKRKKLIKMKAELLADLDKTLQTEMESGMPQKEMHQQGELAEVVGAHKQLQDIKIRLLETIEQTINNEFASEIEENVPNLQIKFDDTVKPSERLKAKEIQLLSSLDVIKEDLGSETATEPQIVDDSEISTNESLTELKKNAILEIDQIFCEAMKESTDKLKTQQDKMKEELKGKSESVNLIILTEVQKEIENEISLETAKEKAKPRKLFQRKDKAELFNAMKVKLLKSIEKVISELFKETKEGTKKEKNEASCSSDEKPKAERVKEEILQRSNKAIKKRIKEESLQISFSNIGSEDVSKLGDSLLETLAKILDRVNLIESKEDKKSLIKLTHLVKEQKKMEFVENRLQNAMENLINKMVPLKAMLVLKESEHSGKRKTLEEVESRVMNAIKITIKEKMSLELLNIKALQVDLIETVEKAITEELKNQMPQSQKAQLSEIPEVKELLAIKSELLPEMEVCIAEDLFTEVSEPQKSQVATETKLLDQPEKIKALKGKLMSRMEKLISDKLSVESLEKVASQKGQLSELPAKKKKLQALRSKLLNVMEEAVSNKLSIEALNKAEVQKGALTTKQAEAQHMKALQVDLIETVEKAITEELKNQMPQSQKAPLSEIPEVKELLMMSNELDARESAKNVLIEQPLEKQKIKDIKNKLHEAIESTLEINNPQSIKIDQSKPGTEEGTLRSVKDKVLRAMEKTIADELSKETQEVHSETKLPEELDKLKQIKIHMLEAMEKQIAEQVLCTTSENSEHQTANVSEKTEISTSSKEDIKQKLVVAIENSVANEISVALLVETQRSHGGKAFEQLEEEKQMGEIKIKLLEGMKQSIRDQTYDHEKLQQTLSDKLEDCDNLLESEQLNNIQKEMFTALSQALLENSVKETLKIATDSGDAHDFKRTEELKDKIFHDLKVSAEESFESKVHEIAKFLTQEPVYKLSEPSAEKVESQVALENIGIDIGTIVEGAKEVSKLSSEDQSLRSKKTELLESMEKSIAEKILGEQVQGSENIDEISASLKSALENPESLKLTSRKELEEVIANYEFLLELDPESVNNLQQSLLKTAMAKVEEPISECNEEAKSPLKIDEFESLPSLPIESPSHQNSQKEVARERENIAMDVLAPVTDDDSSNKEHSKTKGPESLTKDQLAAKRKEILSMKKELLDKQLKEKRLHDSSKEPLMVEGNNESTNDEENKLESDVEKHKSRGELEGITAVSSKLEILPEPEISPDIKTMTDSQTAKSVKGKPEERVIMDKEPEQQSELEVNLSKNLKREEGGDPDDIQSLALDSQQIQSKEPMNTSGLIQHENEKVKHREENSSTESSDHLKPGMKELVTNEASVKEELKKVTQCDIPVDPETDNFARKIEFSKTIDENLQPSKETSEVSEGIQRTSDIDIKKDDFETISREVKVSEASDNNLEKPINPPDEQSKRSKLTGDEDIKFVAVELDDPLAESDKSDDKIGKKSFELVPQTGGMEISKVKEESLEGINLSTTPSGKKPSEETKFVKETPEKLSKKSKEPASSDEKSLEIHQELPKTEVHSSDLTKILPHEKEREKAEEMSSEIKSAATQKSLSNQKQTVKEDLKSKVSKDVKGAESTEVPIVDLKLDEVEAKEDNRMETEIGHKFSENFEKKTGMELDSSEGVPHKCDDDSQPNEKTETQKVVGKITKENIIGKKYDDYKKEPAQISESKEMVVETTTRPVNQDPKSVSEGSLANIKLSETLDKRSDGDVKAKDNSLKSESDQVETAIKPTAVSEDKTKVSSNKKSNEISREQHEPQNMEDLGSKQSSGSKLTEDTEVQEVDKYKIYEGKENLEMKKLEKSVEEDKEVMCQDSAKSEKQHISKTVKATVKDGKEFKTDLDSQIPPKVFGEAEKSDFGLESKPTDDKPSKSKVTLEKETKAKEPEENSSKFLKNDEKTFIKSSQLKEDSKLKQSEVEELKIKNLPEDELNSKETHDRESKSEAKTTESIKSPSRKMKELESDLKETRGLEENSKKSSEEELSKHPESKSDQQKLADKKPKSESDVEKKHMEEQNKGEMKTILDEKKQITEKIDKESQIKNEKRKEKKEKVVREEIFEDERKSRERKKKIDDECQKEEEKEEKRKNERREARMKNEEKEIDDKTFKDEKQISKEVKEYPERLNRNKEELEKERKLREEEEEQEEKEKSEGNKRTREGEIKKREDLQVRDKDMNERRKLMGEEEEIQTEMKNEYEKKRKKLGELEKNQKIEEERFNMEKEEREKRRIEKEREMKQEDERFKQEKDEWEKARKEREEKITKKRDEDIKKRKKEEEKELEEKLRKREEELKEKRKMEKEKYEKEVEKSAREEEERDKNYKKEQEELKTRAEESLREEKEIIERRKKEKQEKGIRMQEEEMQEEKRRREREKKRKAEMEKKMKEDEDRYQKELKEKDKQREKRKQEEERRREEEEKKNIKAEEELKEKRRIRKEEEDKLMGEIEERQKREEEERKKERERQKKEREEEEKRMKAEEEDRRQRRRRFEEEEKKRALEEAKEKEQERKRMMEERKNFEEQQIMKEEMTRKKEEELRQQSEDLTKKTEEERRRTKMEERKRRDDEEELLARDRLLRRIDYSEKELLAGYKEQLKERRARTRSPEESSRRDPRRRPKFSTKLQDRQTLKGTRVRLTCNILTSPEDPLPEVEWYKSGYPVKENDKFKASFLDGVASLEVNNASRSDSGEYTCSAKNRHGRVSTSCDLRVKGEEEHRPTAPTFTTSLREHYNVEEDELILSCHVTGHPTPKIKWLKDADQLPMSPRFHTSFSEEGVCKLIIKSPKAADSGVFTCHAENRVYRDEITAAVHVQGIIDTHKTSKRQGIQIDDSEAPKFVTELCDQNVEENGTLSLQVEVAGNPNPEVQWFFNGRSIPASGKFRISTAGSVHTLTVFQVTHQDLGTYSCRLENKFGHAYTLSSVSLGTSRAKPIGGLVIMEQGKRPLCAPSFAERPESLLTVGRGEEIRLSCVVQGEPTPRVTWHKGAHDISVRGRARKVVKENRHTIVMRDAEFTDSGTYTVEAKNAHGSARAYCSIKVRELYKPKRQIGTRVPSSETDVEIRRPYGRYIRDVPGKVGIPRITDVGRNWVSLSWSKPDHPGGVPVTAYKVEAWILGAEARWQELGVSPIPSFDAYHMKTDHEYLFRVTPRNKYGWGESVMTPRPTRIGRKVDPPSMPKGLPPQVRCMPGGTVVLEGQVTGDPTPEIKWYKDGSQLDTSRYPRFRTTLSDGLMHNIFGFVHKVSIQIEDLQPQDEGRYEVEVVNQGGRVTSGTRVLTTYDCSVIQAQETINRCLMALSRLDEVCSMAPQFTMRLRDRRVQVGFPVRLTCQIVGVPKPDVQWLCDGDPVISNDTHTMWEEDGHFYSLEISSSSHGDAAVYSVRAANEFGAVKCKCRLVVDSGLKSYISPMFLRELEDTSVREGQDVFLEAIIEAYPTIGVVWHRDGHRIRPSRKHSFSLGADGVTVLVVREVDYRDGGLYSCTAANEMGRVESFCRVSVSSTNVGLTHLPDPRNVEQPMFVRKPRTIDAEEGDLVIIECEVAGNPKPSVRWLRDWLEPSAHSDGARFKEVGRGPVYHLEIPQCKLEDTGAYSIVASNDHGEARAVISLQVYAKGLKKLEGGCVKRGVMEYIPSVVRPLQDVRCCDGDSVTLEALFNAPKTAQVRWQKQGKVVKEGVDLVSEWNGAVARLRFAEIYPEDEGEYSCIVFNDLGKAVTSAAIIVEMADDRENDVTIQMDHRPDLSRRSTPSRTTTPSRLSRSPSVGFQREGSAHSWAGVGWREQSVGVPHWRPLSRGSSPLLYSHRRSTPEPTPKSKQRRLHRPKFYYIPRDRIVEEGETVTFQCAVKGNPKPKAIWDKDSRIIRKGGRIKIDERDEIRLLEIPKVTQQDAGLYRITIDNDIGREQATARLDVIKASPHKYLGYVRSWNSSPSSTPRFTRTAPSATIREGGRLMLSTEFRGSPMPRVSWYRNGELLPPSDEYKQTTERKRSTLRIDDMTSYDAGTYSCVLVNDAGKAECSARVTVERPKNDLKKYPPCFLIPLSDTEALDGDEVALSVKLQGSSPMKVLWVRNESEIPPSKDFRQEKGRRGYYSLVIADAFPKDSGIYFCEAYNAYGHAVCNARLNVSDPFAKPKCPPKICGPIFPLCVRAGQSARFSVRVLGTPAPSIEWKLNDQRMVESDNVKLNIEEAESGEGLVYYFGILSVNPSHSGEVSLRVTNSEGVEFVKTSLKVLPNVPVSYPRPRPLRSASLSPSRIPQPKSNHTTTTKGRTSPTKVPLRRNRILKEIATSGSLDSAYASGRSSSQSNPSETECEPISRMETMATQEEQPEMTQKTSSRNTSSSSSHTQDATSKNGQAEEEDTFTEEEETGAVIVSGPRDTIALRGQSATLSAAFRGHPEPQVTWYKKEREIMEDERFSIQTEGNKTSLTIKEVTFDDSDKYTLKVRNFLSAHSTFASLAVEGIPEPPAGKPNLTEVTNSSVTVSWYGPAYDGGKAVTGYRVEGRKIGSLEWTTLVNCWHSTSFKAASLEKGAQYEFRVRAENIHGVSEPSKSSIPITLDDLSDSLSELSEEEMDINVSPYKLGQVALESGEVFDQMFEQHEEVGKGRFGVVYKVSEKPTGARRAAKLIKCIRKEERDKVKEEISIMNALRHPKLLQLLAAFERKRDCVMIMEYISGGELFERVVADDFALTERDCILFVRQICEGVAYMHCHSIVHLDLKPENILCVRRSSHQIKLIDFGLARRLNPNEQCRVLFGTPEFVAPEVINYEPISFSSDMWSVGVICYVLLSGLSPFMGENDAETFANITRAEFDFDDEAFDAISSDAKDFITRILDKRKEKRPTAAECLRGGWLAQSERSMMKVVLSTDKLKRFIIRRKWQKTGNAIRALGRMTNLTNLRNSSPTRLAPLPEDRTASPPSSPSSQTLPSSPKRSPSKSSSVSSVNERSDSGISECSSGIEDYPSRNSSSSLYCLIEDPSGGSPSNSSPNEISFPGGLEKSGKKTERLNWQSSVDSAVEVEEVLATPFQGGIKHPKDSLLPSQTTSCRTVYTHSRV